MVSRALIVASFLSLALSAMEGDESEPLNVILFLVDDLGWRDLSCQGSDYYRTPNIDSLAERGVRFTQAYAAAAICTPTRASLLTGKHPARLLMTQWLPAGRWNQEKHPLQEGRFLRGLPLEETTLAEAFRARNYKTIHIGKWHLGGPPFSLPEQHGFEVNVAGQEHGAPGSYFYPYRGTWQIPTTEEEVIKVTLQDGVEGEYLTDRLTDEALKHLGSDPFFLYFPYYAVHTPLQPKPEKLARYESIPAGKRQGKPEYAAMVESVDDSVGRILKHLEENHLLESTLIVFTSDNGGFAKATDHSPLRANKGSHYEGGIRVPMIVAGPGIQNGTESATPVITHDLYPTILTRSGFPPPAEQIVDGIDLSPVLEGTANLPERSLFWHYPHYNRHPQSAPVSIIRRGDWKLMEFLDQDRFELYNLSTDLGEENDLSAAKPEVATSLQKELSAWREAVDAEPMRPNPFFNPNATAK